jgi:hypothetical protein
LASSSGETTLKLFLNGTLVGTGHDAKGLDQFDVVGIMLVARTFPAAADFDNFHVEEGEDTVESEDVLPAETYTPTSLESEDVLVKETFVAQQAYDKRVRSSDDDPLSLEELQALDDLQALLASDNGITPDEVARMKGLLRALDER